MNSDPIDPHSDIEGTTIFDGRMAMKGYALNKMCYSFNKAENRAAYLADPEAYMQDIGAQQTGMSVEEFKEKLVRQGD